MGYSIRLSVIIVGFLLPLSFLSAQSHPTDTLLRLEKINGVKVKRFFIGDEMRIKPADRSWRWAVIEDFDVREGLVIFDIGAEYVDQLEGIQTYRQYNRAVQTRNFLAVPGTLAMLVGGGQLIFGGPNGAFALIAGGGLVAGGFIAEWVLKGRYYKLNKKWRARILDISPE